MSALLKAMPHATWKFRFLSFHPHVSKSFISIKPSKISVAVHVACFALLMPGLTHETSTQCAWRKLWF